MLDRILVLFCRPFVIAVAAWVVVAAPAGAQQKLVVESLAEKSFKDVRLLAEGKKIPVIVHFYQPKQLKAGDTTYDESTVIANTWESQPGEVLEYQQEGHYSRLGVVLDTSSIPPGDIIVINADGDEKTIPFHSFVLGLVITGLVAAGVGFTIGNLTCKRTKG